jgi:hypothetical protein
LDELAQKKKRLAAIRKAYDTGVLVVRHGDTTTTFRSLSEMERIISRLEDEIAGLEGKRLRPRVKYITQRRKGL